jgi:hypothetical protein
MTADQIREYIANENFYNTNLGKITDWIGTEENARL